MVEICSPRQAMYSIREAAMMCRPTSDAPDSGYSDFVLRCHKLAFSILRRDSIAMKILRHCHGASR